jgi:hypothetical protein
MTDRQTARDRPRLPATVTDLKVPRQRALLVAVAGGCTPAPAEASMAELGGSAETAGSDPVAWVLQQQPRSGPATCEQVVGRAPVRTEAGRTRKTILAKLPRGPEEFPRSPHPEVAWLHVGRSWGVVAAFGFLSQACGT